MSELAEIRRFPGVALQQVETRFDPEYGVYWAYMRPKARQCFTQELLKDLRTYIDSFAANGGSIDLGAERHTVRYGVLASRSQGVFNLGGDLELFRQAIATSDRDLLIAYGDMCVDNLYPWYRNCDLEITTLALVQGEALGGGFEAALSASVLVAEESARMGFPEILFNLFPGMGAYAFLSRKVGRRVADELITSGNIYTGRQLFDLGAVDVLAPDGAGEAALYAYVRKHARNANGRRAYERARLESAPIARDELHRVVEVWADAALRLSERDMRMMDRLVRAQRRAVEVGSDAYAANVVPIVRTAAGD